MKSLQDYLEIYREIAKNLNLQGDSVEMISQMLANATYISEVEHISYSQEASLERATQMNSKIQHCVEQMYSVFRGSCPRVILRFKSTKYFRLNPFDEVVSSNLFKLYYLGYYEDNSSDSSILKSTSLSNTTNSIGTKAVEGEPGFIYAPVTIPPTGDSAEYTIICLLAKEVVNKSWILTESNTYYVDLLENNLSSDLYLKINSEFFNTTRVFSEHIMNGYVFDLTLPGFGSRFYAPDIFRTEFSRTESSTPANTKIDATVFKYCTLDSIPSSDLKSIKMKGAIFTEFPNNFLIDNGYSSTTTGIVFINEIERDNMTTIHYKASRDRFVNSTLRSNSDIGLILEEMYPEKIRKSGTNYRFKSVKTTRVEEQDIVHTFTFGAKDGYIIGNNNLGTSDTGDRLFVYSSETNSDYQFKVDTSKKIQFPDLIPGETFIGNLTMPCKSTFTSSGTPEYCVIRVPINSSRGELKLLHKNSVDEYTTKSIYTILPDVSVINTANNLSSIKLNILRRDIDSGISEIITTKSELDQNLKIYYSINGGVINQISSKELKISIDSSLNKFLRIDIYLENTLISTKIIPVVTDGKDTDYILNLSQNMLVIASDYTGELKENLPISIESTMYVGGNKINPGDSGNLKFDLISTKGIEGIIDENGLLQITSISNEFSEGNISIRATYNGISVISTLNIKKSYLTYLPKDKPRELNISTDQAGRHILKTLKSPIEGSYDIVEYNDLPEEGSNLFLWSTSEGSIEFYDITSSYLKEVVVNVIPEGSEETPSLEIYYIPFSRSSLLSSQEIASFKNQRVAYYVTHDITVNPGIQYNAVFNIKAEIYQNESIDTQVDEIINKYGYCFNMDLDSKSGEIIALLSKISNVKRIITFYITFTSEFGENVEWENIKNDLDISYFNVSYQLNTVLASITDQ